MNLKVQPMKNPTIKELLGKLSKGEISKGEFDLFLQEVKKGKGSSELDHAFLEFFDSVEKQVKNESSNQKPIE